MVKVKYLKCAFVLIVMAILLAGCSLMEDGGDEPVVTSTINFYPEEYEEEFSQYKQEMNVGKENKKLIVKSIVSAGSMEVDVYNPDGDHVKTIFAEDVAESAEALTEIMTGAEETLSDVQKEIKKIMEQMKLVEEDIKGAAVDTVG